MAGDQNVALMLIDVIEIGQLMGYFEKQAIPRINGYFVITVSDH